MDFDDNYYHPMDRNYIPDIAAPKENYNIDIKKTGIAHGIGKPLVGLDAQIKAGASIVELGFGGAGYKSMGDTYTPERISKTERREIKELAEINKVKVTVHSTWAPESTLSGLDTRLGKFSDEARESALTEIKRAIDFSADATNGGPVVVHVGEWDRPIIDVENEFGGGFKSHTNEEKTYRIVNKKTGEISRLDKESMFRLDANGKKIKIDKEGIIDAKKIDFTKVKNPEKEIAKHFEEETERQYRSEAIKHTEMLKHTEEQLNKVNKRLELSEAAAKVGEPLMIRKNDPLYSEDIHGTTIIPEKEELKKLKKELEMNYEWQKQAALSYKQQLDKFKETKGNFTSLKEFALEKAAENIANAAEYAIKKSSKTKDPIFVAPENISPQQYGGHPEELKKIIIESRKQLKERLQKQGKSDSEAEKIAKQHIKATFDVGHANTWKKYFDGSDEEFKKWLVEEVKELKKDDIIGHVHVSDNFGYGDEHLSAGEGNTPLKEVFDELKDEDVVFIAEGGGQQGEYFDALTSLWKQQRNPIYSIGRKDAWTDIEGSYFGKTEKSSYLVGKAAPSKEWQVWSETPLE